MKFTISREALLKPLVLVAGVVERRQTLPILANILLVVEDNQLSLTGTDLEVELVGRALLSEASVAGSITVPARKLLDICKSLPDHAMIEISQQDDHVFVRSARSKFKLSTLPANDFPNVEDSPESFEFELPQTSLRSLIDKTGFAMAQQDVRYYLNGMLFEIKASQLRTVATDGHRLATSVTPIALPEQAGQQLIVPRKGVLELARLMTDEEATVKLVIGASHVRAFTQDFIFTSKLVDGKFPDYDRVLPKNGDKIVLIDRVAMRGVLSRAAILSNEKYRGVRVTLSDTNLQVVANNPEQEEAEENLMVDYQGVQIEIGFNVGYVLDVLSVLGSEEVKMTLSDANSSALLSDGDEGDAQYVIMPMRL
ncbi:MAG TPA: DNA polymerase III subunit beta [Oceanospirillaceae bacterium]|nr:DNA polymerase III subunit beta [Oceanospirillaceae bacterium]